MAGPVLGLHHVTATVDLAQADLDFCAGALGLRLVKKTVNFDNHHVYHFYYGDERGTPGTIWTTFPYHGHGVRAGRHGAGQITATAFSVPAETLPAWTSRLATRGFVPRAAPPRFGASVVTVTDPAGLVIELVAAKDDRTPWIAPDVGADMAIRGVHGVAERANALLKETFAALQRVSLSPTRIGAITKAALVLLHLEHGRPIPGGYTA